MKYYTVSFKGPNDVEVIIRNVAAKDMEDARRNGRSRLRDEIEDDREYLMKDPELQEEDWVVELSGDAFPGLKIVATVKASDKGLAIAKARVMLNGFLGTDPTAGVLENEEAVTSAKYRIIV